MLLIEQTICINLCENEIQNTKTYTIKL